MNLRLRLLAFSLLVLPLTALAAGPSNKWRIQINHSAKVDGEVELSFTPKDATAATSVVVKIPAGTHENQAARLIRDAIRAQFGKSIYKTEIDDGEDVLVKTRGSTPNVEIVVVRNTAEGLSLNLDRE